MRAYRLQRQSRGQHVRSVRDREKEGTISERRPHHIRFPVQPQRAEHRLCRRRSFHGLFKAPGRRCHDTRSPQCSLFHPDKAISQPLEWQGAVHIESTRSGRESFGHTGIPVTKRAFHRIRKYHKVHRRGKRRRCYQTQVLFP